MICNIPDCTTHYGCRLRAKGITIAASATPTRVQDRPQPIRPMQDPSWEKGIEGSHRPDGSFMPILNDKGSPMGVKEAQDNRRRVDQTRRMMAPTAPRKD